MLKKGHEIKWTAEAKKYFKEIKQAISEAPVLVSLEFTKDFLIFSYASKHTIATVLLQKNNENMEQPISFFSNMLRDGELKYDIIKKESYALVKALKDFRVYILHSHIIAHVPTSAVKGILTQPDPEGSRTIWIATLLEYDIDIRPTKLIKGQGLEKMLTDSNCESLQFNFLSSQYH